MPPRAQAARGRRPRAQDHDARRPVANPANPPPPAPIGYAIPPRPARPETEAPTDENRTIHQEDGNADGNADVDAVVQQHRQRQRDEAAMQPSYTTSYDGCDWARLPGYQQPYQSTFTRFGDVWAHGYDIFKVANERRYWCCKICHQARAAITHIYDGTGTSNHAKHLAKQHQIYTGGQRPPQTRPKTLSIIEQLQLNATQIQPIKR